MNDSHEDHSTILHCDKRLSLENIHTQKNIFIDVLAIKKPIIFDAHSLSYIDTAGLQLLLSVVLAADTNRIPWTWRQPSAALLQCANLLGMSQLLKLPKK